MNWPVFALRPRSVNFLGMAFMLAAWRVSSGEEKCPEWAPLGDSEILTRAVPGQRERVGPVADEVHEGNQKRQRPPKRPPVSLGQAQRKPQPDGECAEVGDQDGQSKPAAL